MKKFLTAVAILFATISFSQVKYEVKRDDILISENKKTKEVYVETPQKKFKIAYEYASTASNGSDTALIYNGVKATVALGENWMSLSCENGEVYFWNW